MKAVKKLFSNLLFAILTKNDPVFHCDVYKEKGCSHVDGFLCDFETCSMRLDYKKEKNDNSN